MLYEYGLYQVAFRQIIHYTSYVIHPFDALNCDSYVSIPENHPGYFYHLRLHRVHCFNAGTIAFCYHLIIFRESKRW